MRLRTLTGQRWPAKCADGCGAEIPSGPEVKVVVDLEARPRKAWLPEHSPDAGTWSRGRSPASSPSPTNGGNSSAASKDVGLTKAPSPNRAPPPPPSPARPSARPPTSDMPSEPTHEEEDALAGPHRDRTWTSGSLALASCRSGIATYAQPGETDEQLLARVNLLLSQDLETKVRAVQALRISLGMPERGRSARPEGGA